MILRLLGTYLCTFTTKDISLGCPHQSITIMDIIMATLTEPRKTVTDMGMDTITGTVTLTGTNKKSNLQNPSRKAFIRRRSLRSTTAK